MLKEKPRCPNCNGHSVVRHCASSPYCNWYICYCENSALYIGIVFDNHGRAFLEKKK